MADIEPGMYIDKYAPRSVTLVDAVAEAARIADQSLRANPLKNARVDSGLTRWLGNYGGSLLWVGEITPYDQNLQDAYGNPKPQRGFVLQRDDPGGHLAIALYDSNPQPGVPLQQTLHIYDVDGRVVYRESLQGGIGFPDRPIVMYPRVNIESGMTNASDDTPWIGSGNITAMQIQFQGNVATGGTVTVTSFVRVVGIGGTVVDSPTRVFSGPTIMDELIDISAIYDAGEDFVEVQWHTYRSAGTGNYFPRPARVRNLSP